MKTRSKEELKAPLPPLCAAVKRVRAAYGDTLQRFAERVGISMNSLSRFELGKQVPADHGVLKRLEHAARERGLREESVLFLRAGYIDTGNLLLSCQPRESAAPIAPTYSPLEWRLMQAARVAIRLYPESARAIEKAAGPALGLVDEVLRSADAADLTPEFYEGLERRLTLLADRRAFENLKQEKDQ
jgi:transcriptional regulator with XRE-family HTH domain